MLNPIKTSVFSGLFGMSAMVSITQAALSLELRFPDGNNSRIINIGDLTPITIQAWVKVTGASENNSAEGLFFTSLAVKSKLVNSGISGSISSASRAIGWNGSGSTGGLPSNISNDGIGDWGNEANMPFAASESMGYFRARTTKATNNPVDWGDFNSPAGSVYNQFSEGGREFLVGLFTFKPTTANWASSLKYVPSLVKNASSVSTAAQGWYEDTADKTALSPTGGRTSAPGAIQGTFSPASPNTAELGSVTITVIPEPSAIGMLGLAGLLGLKRRQRKRIIENHVSEAS